MAATPLFAALYAVSVAGALMFLLIALRVPRRTVARDAHAVYALATAGWSLGAAWSLVGGQAVVLSKTLVLPSAALVVASVYCLARALSDARWRPSRSRLGVLAVHPVLMIVASATDPWHHGIITVEGTYGPLFWVHVALSYGVLGVSVARLLHQRRGTPSLQSAPVTTVLATWSLPMVGNMVSLFVIGPSGPDVTPLFFAVVAAITGRIVMRAGLPDLVPIARAHIFQHLAEAVLVLDPEDRIGDANARALGLLEVTSVAEVLGRKVGAVNPGLAHVVSRPGEHRITVAGAEVILAVDAADLQDRTGAVVARAVTVRDVTTQVLQREALRDANDALTAEAEVNERLRADLAEMAIRDAGTGLRNRRYIDARLPVLMERSTPENPLSLVMVDVDHFKRINDVHGHSVGDRVLSALAEAMARVARSAGGEAIRFGGEEFVVVLPRTGTAEAVVLAEAVRRACAASAIPAREGAIHVRVSAGVATTGPGATDPERLIEAADAALYDAKRSGRDRTAVFTAGASRVPSEV